MFYFPKNSISATLELIIFFDRPMNYMVLTFEIIREKLVIILNVWFNF